MVGEQYLESIISTVKQTLNFGFLFHQVKKESPSQIWGRMVINIVVAFKGNLQEYLVTARKMISVYKDYKDYENNS